MALTATASRRVEADIIQQLRMRDPLVLRSPFDRPNIHLSVRYLDVQRSATALCTDALPALLALLREQEAVVAQGGRGSEGGSDGSGGAAIIYCHKRDDCDRVAAAVTRTLGRRCASYHAGLPDSVRSAVLADWQGRRLHCVAATVAWGMGIDRPDVRLVVHLSLPKSIEA